MGSKVKGARGLARELATVYGDQLISVILYGSGAREEHRDRLSDLNVLVLLERADPAALRKASAVAGRWARRGNPPPLILAADDWDRSRDVFPIEFAEIADARRVLLGSDPFEGLSVPREQLRAQCEYELRSRFIQLREQYLLHARDPKRLAQTALRSVSTFLVLFRTVLRLLGTAVPPDSAAVVERTAGVVGFDAGPILELLRLRAEAGRPRLTADGPLLEGYLSAVAETVHFVDRLPPTSTREDS
ncbi:MAG: hypothetical protein ACREKN_06345 [Longimicrobiaceae bacterium]